jgi:hypothetical protein
MIAPFRTALIAIGVIFALLLPSGSEAEPMRVNGITFSDELGGFEITGVSGAGTPADPFVVQENITSVSTDVVLVIKDIDPSIGNLVGTHHAFAFVLNKVVTNKTPRAWTRFALELREMVETYSPYGDGLSFGQASTAGRPYVSPQFLSSNETEEPYDQLEFSGGRIEPGATVSMTFVISDASPEAIFYLLQQPGQVIAAIPGAQIAQRPETPRKSQ